MKRTRKTGKYLQLSTYEKIFGPLAIRPSVATLDFWDLIPKSDRRAARKRNSERPVSKSPTSSSKSAQG